MKSSWPCPTLMLNEMRTYRKTPAPDGEPPDVPNSFSHRQPQDYVRVVVSP